MLNGQPRFRAVASWGLGGSTPLPFLSEQLTLSQPGGADYAHHINTGTPGFSDLPTALTFIYLDHAYVVKVKVEKI